MGIVMVKCPHTGRSIPTGIVADRLRFSSTPVFFARVYCPICRAEHEWFAKNAWVCESEQRSPGNENAEGVVRWQSLPSGEALR